MHAPPQGARLPQRRRRQVLLLSGEPLIITTPPRQQQQEQSSRCVPALGRSAPWFSVQSMLPGPCRAGRRQALTRHCPWLPSLTCCRGLSRKGPISTIVRSDSFGTPNSSDKTERKSEGGTWLCFLPWAFSYKPCSLWEKEAWSGVAGTVRRR